MTVERKSITFEEFSSDLTGFFDFVIHENTTLYSNQDEKRIFERYVINSVSRATNKDRNRGRQAVLRPDFNKWNQTGDDLLQLAREAAHARSRERYLALYAIGSGQSNATRWAQATGRENAPKGHPVMGWIHAYNTGGPAALVYRHSGGRAPFLPRRQALKW